MGNAVYDIANYLNLIHEQERMNFIFSKEDKFPELSKRINQKANTLPRPIQEFFHNMTE